MPTATPDIIGEQWRNIPSPSSLPKGVHLPETFDLPNEEGLEPKPNRFSAKLEQIDSFRWKGLPLGKIATRSPLILATLLSTGAIDHMLGHYSVQAQDLPDGENDGISPEVEGAIASANLDLNPMDLIPEEAEAEPEIAAVVTEAEAPLFDNLCGQEDILPSRASPTPTTLLKFRNFTNHALSLLVKSFNGSLIPTGIFGPKEERERPTVPTQLFVIQDEEGNCVYAVYPKEEEATLDIGTQPPPEIYGDLSQGLQINYEVKNPVHTTVKIVPRDPQLEQEFLNFVQKRISSDPVNNVPTKIHIVDMDHEIFGPDPERGWVRAGDATVGLKFFNVRTFPVKENGKTVAMESWITFNPDMFNSQNLDILSRIQRVDPQGRKVTIDARYDSMLPGIQIQLMAGLKGVFFPVSPDIDQFARKKYPFALEWYPTGRPEEKQTF